MASGAGRPQGIGDALKKLDLRTSGEGSAPGNRSGGAAEIEFFL